MTRQVLATALAIIVVLVSASTASAGKKWCRADPVLDIEGTRVQVLVGIPDAKQALVTGPIQIDVQTPPGAARQVVMTDAGFNGYGEVVTFSDSTHALHHTLVVK